MCQIHFCICAGNVTENTTLFSLPNVDYDPSFVPKFYDSIDDLFGNNTELRQQAISLCGPTKFHCLFDYALTSDAQAVSESQSSLNDFEAEEKQLSKS